MKAPRKNEMLFKKEFEHKNYIFGSGFINPVKISTHLYLKNIMFSFQKTKIWRLINLKI